MKEVIFKKISIQNFLSVGNEPIIIEFKEGLNLITGDNLDKVDSKNGVGKSTIVDAIFFGVYGTPLRNIKKDDLVNWDNKKECAVAIDFETRNNGKTDVYNIYRSISPSKIRFMKNGEDISRNISKTKDEIYDIIGATPEIFEQCVIMSLNDTEPFLSKTPAIKKKFIEYVYDIEIFSLMAKCVREDYNTLKKDLDLENRRKEDNDNNIDIHKRNESNYIEDKKNKILNFAKSLKSKTDERTRIESFVDPHFDGNEKSVLEKSIEEITKKEDIINKTKNQIEIDNAGAKREIKLCQKLIDELLSIGDDHCITCKRPFEDVDKNLRENELKKYRQEIEDNRKKEEENQEKARSIKNIEEKIMQKRKDINSRIKDIEAAERQTFENITKIKSLENEINFISENIKKIKDEKNPYSDIINDLNIKSGEIEERIKEYKEKNNILDTMRFVLSDEGVKNIIIKKMLKVLNGRLGYYLNRLDVPCSCEFNEYFEERIVNNRGKECSYFNFSGGERKRIDLAMLFTFMDIRRIQSGIYINIGFYDELLDNALDAVGIDKTLELLRERTDNNKEALYIISHKKDISKIDADNIIILEKRNNITTRRI